MGAQTQGARTPSASELNLSRRITFDNKCLKFKIYLHLQVEIEIFWGEFDMSFSPFQNLSQKLVVGSLCFVIINAHSSPLRKEVNAGIIK